MKVWGGDVISVDTLSTLPYSSLTLSWILSAAPLPPINHPGKDQNLTNEYNSANLLLLHHAYDHTPNTLLPPRSTGVGNINTNEQGPAGRDGPEGGGRNSPPWQRQFLSSLSLMTAAAVWGPTIYVLCPTPPKDGPWMTSQPS